MAEEPSKLDISDEMIAERRGGSGKMPEDMPLWMAKSIVNIDKYPILNQQQALRTFFAKFQKNCGADELCQAQLIVKMFNVRLL